MAKLELIRHPQQSRDGVSAIQVEVLRTPPAVLAVLFRAVCPPGAVLLPPITPPKRVAQLWEHTCFELFVRGPGTTYCEFNFSPSGQWAAYEFSDTRTGMIDLNIPTPAIEPHRGDIAFALRVAIDLSYAPRLISRHEPWQMGVSAVIESSDKRLSHWALRHPTDKPDFHHPDAFAYTLPRT